MPADRFDLLTAALSELLAEHSGRIFDADLDELADLIAQFVFDRGSERAEPSLQRLDDWLDRTKIPLRANLH